jgi:hypothetical protein
MDLTVQLFSWHTVHIIGSFIVIYFLRNGAGMSLCSAEQLLFDRKLYPRGSEQIKADCVTKMRTFSVNWAPRQPQRD